MPGIFLQCKHCIMDTYNDSDLVLDSNGICNHCLSYNKEYAHLPKEEERAKKLKEITTTIKENGKNKKYDCLMGVSGGVDSTYLTDRKFKLSFTL